MLNISKIKWGSVTNEDLNPKVKVGGSSIHPSLEENWDFVTNKFATSCDYLTFTTIVRYIYNYFLHLKPPATTL